MQHQEIMLNIENKKLQFHEICRIYILLKKINLPSFQDTYTSTFYYYLSFILIHNSRTSRLYTFLPFKYSAHRSINKCLPKLIQSNTKQMMITKYKINPV